MQIDQNIINSNFKNVHNGLINDEMILETSKIEHIENAVLMFSD